MTTGLAGGMPVEPLQALGNLDRDLLRHRHDPFHSFPMIRPFGVAEGHEEERLLPRSGESVIVTVAQSLLGDPQGGGIAGIGFGRACEQAARKLVENDDQRQTSERGGEPGVQTAGLGSLEHGGKPRQFRIGAAAEPPVEHPVVSLRVGVLQIGRKPEIVNAPPIRFR
jgi:hypothetical protein